MLITDEAGQFEVTSSPDHIVRLELLEEHWWSKSVTADFAVAEPIVMVLSAAKSVSFRALCEDGQPLTYAISLKNKDIGYSEMPSLAVDGTVTVKRVPIDRPLACKAFCRRIGYDDGFAEFSVADLNSGRELQIVAPKSDKPLGGIRVQFVGALSGIDSSVTIESDDGFARGGQLGPDRDHWESDKLPAGYRYRVSILGPWAWRSNWIEVETGKVSTVEATLAPGAVVRARLIDTDAFPVVRGALRPSNGSYLCFRGGKPPLPNVPLHWVSDADGNVCVTGLPAGKITLEAEAAGREPVTIECNTVAGQQIDLGEIVLNQAIGTITLELVGTKEGSQYRVFLSQPNEAGVIFPPYRLDDATHAYAGLPLRGYTVFATLAGGGSVARAKINLSPEQYSVTVQLDVSELEP
ncbi:MAG: carboxypeptidase regulatory-like domain-containing protein [Planctomycetes bacterium]|nr:carboxypeptidase regulatory-like domain-containing protein [Planctomycetota bacterium]